MGTLSTRIQLDGSISAQVAARKQPYLSAAVRDAGGSTNSRYSTTILADARALNRSSPANPHAAADDAFRSLSHSTNRSTSRFRQSHGVVPLPPVKPRSASSAVRSDDVPRT